MTNIVGISIKGRRPHSDYGVTLLDLFDARDRGVCSRSEFEEALGVSSVLRITCDPIELVFPASVIAEGRDFSRFPCRMIDAPDSKVRLNLLYQDTRIKLGVEDCVQRRGDRDADHFRRQSDARALLEIYLRLLQTDWREGTPMWHECTDNDLDALTFALLNAYDPGRPVTLLRDGRAANCRSAESLDRLLSGTSLALSDYVPYQINAGRVWWHVGNDTEVSSTKPVINDYEQFADEVFGRKCALVFMFDDNGELVWDLKLIDRILSLNDGLRVVGVVSSRVVSNNATAATVAECLSWPIFHGLRDNPAFRVLEEDNWRSAIDLSYCSRHLLDTISQADLCYIKGVSFFETLQEMPITSYYGFVVHSADSQTCTGLQEGDGVFARIPNGRAGFRYGVETLAELHPSFK